MSTMDAILLGVLQGLTEFLPVSSSAHLVAAQELLGVHSPGILLEVALHLGTLVAILVVFWRELLTVAADGCRGLFMHLKGGRARAVSEQAPLFSTAVAIVVGSVPVVCVGVLFEEAIEGFFDSLLSSGAFLLLTGLILLSSRFAPRPRTDRVGAGRGFVIGIAQAAALLPGISRSGATIVTGCLLGVDRRAAGRFSFLLVVPALAGAALWKLRHVLPAVTEVSPGAEDPLVQAGVLAAGALVSAVVGTVCLLLLLRVVERGRLHWFAAYCLPVGALMTAAGLLS